MKKYIFTFLASFLLPALAWAQCASTPTSINIGSGNNTTSFSTIICYIIGLINLLTPILFAAAFIIFFWGLSKYVISAGDEKQLKLGKQYMMWGILALFVLTSYTAIINIASGELDFGTPSTTGALLPQ